MQHPSAVDPHFALLQISLTVVNFKSSFLEYPWKWAGWMEPQGNNGNFKEPIMTAWDCHWLNLYNGSHSSAFSSSHLMPHIYWSLDWDSLRKCFFFVYVLPVSRAQMLRKSFGQMRKGTYFFGGGVCFGTIQFNFIGIVVYRGTHITRSVLWLRAGATALLNWIL